MAEIVELASVRHLPDDAAVVPNAFTVVVRKDGEGYGLLQDVAALWMSERGVDTVRLSVSLQRVPEALPGLPIK